jgi:hypothetical protein
MKDVDNVNKTMRMIEEVIVTEKPMFSTSLLRRWGWKDVAAAYPFRGN